MLERIGNGKMIEEIKERNVALDYVVILVKT